MPTAVHLRPGGGEPYAAPGNFMIGEWFSAQEVVRLAAQGQIADGSWLTGISCYLGPYRLVRGKRWPP